MEKIKNTKTKIVNENGREYWLVMDFEDYCLLQSTEKADNFVVAWLLKPCKNKPDTARTYTWEHGHYCCNLQQAVECFNEKINPKVKFVYIVVTADSDNIGNEIEIHKVTHSEDEARALFAELVENQNKNVNPEEILVENEDIMLMLCESDTPTYWLCGIFKNEVSS